MRFETVALLAIAGAGMVNAQVATWGQCGGIDYKGQTTCTSGNTCTVINDWYYQCLPTPAGVSTTTTTKAAPVTSTVSSTATTGPTSVPVTGGLHAKIKAKGKQYFGTACDQNTLSIGALNDIVKAEFGSVTPENSMKWDSTESSRGSFSLTGGDYLVNFAQTNGKKVRGHTLVWHSQLPGWVSNINDAATLTSVIQTHVTTLMTRWKGKIDHWDVVNEVFEDNGNWRNSVFYRVLGEQFVHIAFRAAAAADPSAKLFINDYNLDYAGAKLDATVALIGRLKAAGVPIHGVGTQAHLISGSGSISGFAGTINTLAGTGLDVAITELDIRMTLPSDSTKVATQAANYKTVTQACLNQSKCVGITIWGVDDGHSWVPQTFSGQGDALLWNSGYNKKAAYNSVADALA